MKQSNYIAEFKDKNQYEQRINTAWRRAESECVETLLEHSEISSELTDKIQAWLLIWHIPCASVKALAVKPVSYKDCFRNFRSLLRKGLP
jgi:hypothetical protein